MPEKINIRDAFNNFSQANIVDHAVISAASSLDIDLCVKLADKGDVDVILTFDGVEVPFVEFLNRFQESADKWVEDAALAMVQEKCQELYDKIDAMTGAIDNDLAKLFPDYKPDRHY
jgi:hypothetical protein